MNHITNIVRRPQTFERAQREATRHSDGRQAGYTLMFCACPQCGNRMQAGGAPPGLTFVCRNHSVLVPEGWWPTELDGRPGRLVEKTAKFIYRYHPSTGVLELYLIDPAPHQADGQLDLSLKGFYPLIGPAGSIA